MFSDLLFLSSCIFLCVFTCVVLHQRERVNEDEMGGEREKQKIQLGFFHEGGELIFILKCLSDIKRYI